MNRIVLNIAIVVNVMLASLSISLPAQQIQDEVIDYISMQQELDEIRKDEVALKEKAVKQLITKEEYQQRRERVFSRFLKLMTRADRGVFLLVGKVVDEDGQSVEGVKLAVVKRIKTGIETSRSETANYNVSGTFSVREKGYTSVTLIFSKKGYYSNRMRFRTELDEEAFDEGRVVPNRIEKRNLRVELHRIGEVANVRKHSYQPQVFVKDSGVVLRLQSFNDISLDRSFPRVQEIQRARDEVPELAVYLTTALDDSGKIRQLEGAVHPFPHEVTLALNATDGGFILHEGGAPENGFWLMDEPPEEGYKQEVKLDGRVLYDRIITTQHPLQGLYFYFKIGDTYGKAKLNSLRIIDNGNTLHSNIEMLFQPNGTRFLRTEKGSEIRGIYFLIRVPRRG